MKQAISAITVLVPNYDAGLDFYCGKLGFQVLENTVLDDTKRWVLVSPSRNHGTGILLAKAVSTEEKAAIGNQAGGRVFLFLRTDNFDRDFAAFTGAGVQFLEEPRTEPYGKVAVFQDPFGNKWDLIQNFE